MDGITKEIATENETLEVIADELAYLKPVPGNLI